MIRIKSIEFFDHVIFGNQKFDFTIDGNIPVNNIIIAGENGSGKTRFLEELYDICNRTFHLTTTEYPHKTHEIILDLSDESYCDLKNENKMINKAVLIVYDIGNNMKSYNVSFFANDVRILNVKKIGTVDQIFSLTLKNLYSSVDINYIPNKNVTGVTNSTLDNDTPLSPRNDLAHEITQLLVNIATQDSNDIDTWVGSHTGMAPPDNIYHVRLKRFTDAFEKMFGSTIQYKGIKNNTIPIFSKNGNDVEISSLSSGEKQIIYRGIYLLRDKNSLKGVPVLIDEPEISMHPKWEQNIFEYYRNIFCENSIQTSQLFIATHSEHILSDVLSRDDCLVIKLKGNGHEKFYKGARGMVLPTISIAEIKYAIFDLYTTDFHNALYTYIQQNCVLDSDDDVMPSISEVDKWLKEKSAPLYDYHVEYRNTRGRLITIDCETLPTYVRNCIDHPNNNIRWEYTNLVDSINTMIRIIKENNE